MHESSSFGILCCTHGGKNRCNAGSDILSHNNRNGSSVRNDAGCRKCLKDSHRSGTRLNDCGENRTNKHAQNRVLEHNEQFLKSGNIPQPGDSAGHGFHPEHQRGKSQQNHADVFLFIALCKHQENDTDQGENWREGGRF